jgi:hypothetical protein
MAPVHALAVVSATLVLVLSSGHYAQIPSPGERGRQTMNNASNPASAQLLVLHCSRSVFAAATIFVSASLTSGRRRVFSPQSGFTQS